MARTTGVLPEGTRITDFVSLGVIGKTFPVNKVNRILIETGRASKRQRDLPAHVVVYYVIALALFMGVSYREVLRCLLEGLEWLTGMPMTAHVSAKSAISQARTRLGVEPLRQLHEKTVAPIATEHTKGAWYRKWRLVSLDGSTLETADTQANADAFGRPGASWSKKRLSATSLRQSGRERNSCAVWKPHGQLSNRRSHARQRGTHPPKAGHAMSGRP